SYGDTVVLVSVVTAPPRSEGIDFFPLSVDYREKQSAAGKFPGGFFKREGRPTTKEILTARMIDRPIRPLFPEGYFQEVQIMASVLSADNENDPDILAMIGASAALTISKIPFQGPIGACRLSRVNGEFIINPTHQQLNEGDLNLLLGGRKEAINMIEVGSKELSEEIVAESIQTAHKTVIEICELIEELGNKIPVEKEIPLIELDEEIYEKVNSQISDKLYEIMQIHDKQQRNESVKNLLEQAQSEYLPDDVNGGPDPKACVMFKRIFEKIEKKAVRKLVLEGKRPDGRAYDEIRDIKCEVGFLPRTHGSALFSRGETQSLISVTLGTVRDAQIIDGLLEEYTQNFTLHYNFPPYSVGEVWPNRGPKRREIGHGTLAERALEAVKPSEDKFAYTVRIVSDITESNGSSSMASVCGGSLGLMDAGVPIKSPVAGISIGMVTDEEAGRYELLTDIIGDEDHFGDMDFKVAGTERGITAIQLDIKKEGLQHNIMLEALEQARKSRLVILESMNKVISEPRPELSAYAPKLISIEIDPDMIGKVIGPGGKMIKDIQERTNTTIEIEEDGTIFISCVAHDGHLKAKEIIEQMTTPPEVGRIYEDSRVVSVKDFGVFVEITPGVEGLCHISELDSGYIKNVEQVCKTGDLISVKLLAIDDQGRFKLSRKAALAEKNKDQQEVQSS
ncbi:MAG: polyribonucleotide nucleotidyltransferase, partial [Planctomycetota bacterium]